MKVFRILIGAAAAGLALSGGAADIEIDFETAAGEIKPVHSVGQGPLLECFGVRPLARALAGALLAFAVAAPSQAWKSVGRK